MNKYIVKIKFFGGNRYQKESMSMELLADSVDGAYIQVDAAIKKNPELYPSDDYTMEIL